MTLLIGLFIMAVLLFIGAIWCSDDSLDEM
jgi:hypothetical protein